MNLYFVLMFMAIVARLVPHPANLAPIGGLALFMGVMALQQKTNLNKGLAFIIPLIALIISDAILGFYTWQVMASVYLSFGLIALVGLAVHKHYRWQTILLGSLTGSVLFFLITNGAVWAFSGMYQQTLAGLVECYTLAVPFFRNTVIGDLLYTGMLFGAYEAAKNHITIKIPQLTTETR